MERGQNAIGPAIENGFYQDFDMGGVKISEEDFPKIEKRMREILPTWKQFSYKEVSLEEAKKCLLTIFTKLSWPLNSQDKEKINHQ